MSNVSDFYLILDRADPTNPRLVVARACVSRPTVVPADLDGPDGPAGGMAWLGEFDGEGFAWLARVFGRTTMLRLTNPGEECLATRISHTTPNTWPDDDGGDYETNWLDDGTVYHYWNDTWDDTSDTETADA